MTGLRGRTGSGGGGRRSELRGTSGGGGLSLSGGRADGDVTEDVNNVVYLLLEFAVLIPFFDLFEVLKALLSAAYCREAVEHDGTRGVESRGMVAYGYNIIELH